MFFFLLKKTTTTYCNRFGRSKCFVVVDLVVVDVVVAVVENRLVANFF